jgi:sulfoquinovosyltransferase
MGYKVLKRFNPDIIHMTSPGFFGITAVLYSNILVKKPLIMSYHTHLPVYSKRYFSWIPGIDWLAWRLIEAVHNRADLTLATSPQIAEELRTEGKLEQVGVWRKGIDTEKFHPRFKSFASRSKMTGAGNEKDFLMLYCGRLDQAKRIEDILPILEKMPHARLALVGTGPQEDELKKLFLANDSVKDRVVFVGQMHGQDVSEAFASADALIMPSDTETLGFVVLESMASGTPVVAAKAGGIPDLIRDGDTSYLIPAGDIDGYVEKLSTLRDDKAAADAMGVRGREEAELWGWEAATSVLRNEQYPQAIANYKKKIEERGEWPVRAIRNIFWSTPLWLLSMYVKQVKKLILGFGTRGREENLQDKR